MSTIFQSSVMSGRRIAKVSNVKLRSTTCVNIISKIRVYFISPYRSIVQVIFSFWSFEISEDILRNQKFIIG